METEKGIPIEVKSDMHKKDQMLRDLEIRIKKLEDFCYKEVNPHISESGM